jgi:hypothetical protein
VTRIRALLETRETRRLLEENNVYLDALDKELEGRGLGTSEIPINLSIGMALCSQAQSNSKPQRVWCLKTRPGEQVLIATCLNHQSTIAIVNEKRFYSYVGLARYA